MTTGVGAWPSVSHMLGMDVRDLFIILMRQFSLSLYLSPWQQ